MAPGPGFLSAWPYNCLTPFVHVVDSHNWLQNPLGEDGKFEPRVQEDHLEEVAHAATLPNKKDPSTGVAGYGCTLQHCIFPGTSILNLSMDAQHNFLEGITLDHLYCAIYSGIESKQYPCLTRNSWAESLASWPFGAAMDAGVVESTTPTLPRPTTFQGSIETPQGNRLKWTSGMTMAVIHDIVPLLSPLLCDVDGSYEVALADPIWENLFKHCR